ncbi:hypothetical protein TNCV_5134881 [Trichonephila clavipes]|nr:hypothetical protein TNCV_5134881 [Trichonephila clavipes]
MSPSQSSAHEMLFVVGLFVAAIVHVKLMDRMQLTTAHIIHGLGNSRNEKEDVKIRCNGREVMIKNSCPRVTEDLPCREADAR